jgi:type IV secretion system protein VirB6
VRLLTIVAVFGVGLRLWLYHSVIVDTFFVAPVELAARLVGAADPVAIIDTIWDRGGAVAGALWDKGGLLTGDVGFYIAAAAIYALVGFVCVYTMFLIALSRIALAVLLALGPLFIVMALFDATRRFFEAWLHELSNYALVAILTVMVCALMLDLVEAYAAQTAARGAALLTVDALNLALAAGLVLLVLRQVLPLAARLAGGLALSGFGAVERAAQRAVGVARGATLLAAEVVPEAEPTRPAQWRAARGVSPGGGT